MATKNRFELLCETITEIGDEFTSETERADTAESNLDHLKSVTRDFHTWFQSFIGNQAYAELTCPELDHLVQALSK